MTSEAVRRGEARARREVREHVTPDLDYVSPNWTPWCRFERGSIWCVNDPCRNPRHYYKENPDGQQAR